MTKEYIIVRHPGNILSVHDRDESQEKLKGGKVLKRGILEKDEALKGMYLQSGDELGIFISVEGDRYLVLKDMSASIMAGLYKNLSLIRCDYFNNIYSNKKPYPKEKDFPEGYVFDEDRSVKWNREQVVIENAEIAEARSQWRREDNELKAKLRKDILKYLIAECGVNFKQAEILYNFVYAEKHSCMSDFFEYISECGELVDRILKAKN